MTTKEDQAEDTILDVRDLKVWFPIRKGVFARTVGHVKAVDGVSFRMKRGETLGILGESGSGKSTVARTIAGLQRPTSGFVDLHGRAAMVFQDPLGSLNPRMTVRATLEEVLRRYPHAGRTPAGMLAKVGLDADALDKYPHSFSGGQRQRICIARAISSDPDLLICDEAVSALDLSVRAMVLDLLADLKAELSLSLLFITHDLGATGRIADRVLVMNRGRKEEEGPCLQVLKSPKAAYTKYLVDAAPRIGKPLT